MISKSRGLVSRISKYLPIAEIICLALLMIGIVIAMNTDDITIVVLPVTGLACVFLLNAYAPQAHSEAEGPSQFAEMLAKRIIPKVLWIASSVITLGLLFFVLGYDPENYRQLLLIGVVAMTGGLLTIAAVAVSGVKGVAIVAPVLYRAIPLAIIGSYVLWLV
jgi:hydrogenase/urease accessory protein HupE